jgi:hypothetical protein
VGVQESAVASKLATVAAHNPAEEAGSQTDCVVVGSGTGYAAAAARSHLRDGPHRNPRAAAGAARTGPCGETAAFRIHRVFGLAPGATWGGLGSRPSFVQPVKASANVSSRDAAGSNQPVQARRGFRRGVSIAV